MLLGKGDRLLGNHITSRIRLHRAQPNSKEATHAADRLDFCRVVSCFITDQGKADQDQWDISWSVPKKHFCCSFVDIGCDEFDCQLQLHQWRTSWSVAKTL